MGWLKLDDKFPRNPKVLASDLEASWFYVCVLSHCAEQLTDGFLADTAVPLVAPHVDAPRDVAERLVAVDLICRVDGGYMVPDYLDFNPSRESVLGRRAKDAERQSRHRSQRESQRDTEETSGVSPRVPSRPVPTGDSSSRQSSSTSPPSAETTTKAEQVADAVVEHRAKSRGKVGNKGWARSVRKNLRTDDGGAWWAELERVCATYPGAPVSMLVGAAEGEPSPHLKAYRVEEAS